MDTLDQNLSSLLNYGVSDHLIQNLQAIEETTEEGGRPMYEQSSIYEMRCAIFCRNYAKTLWEFSHYVSVFEFLNPAGVIDLFWSKGVTTSQRFKNWVAGLASVNQVEVSDQGVISIRFAEREFVLSAKRVNIMAAWTVFLATVEPDFLLDLNQFKHKILGAEIEAFARKLKLRLDAYLEPHLQALHQQRQGRVLLSYLKAQAEHCYDSILTDQTVLDFWIENANKDEGDFKRFATVAQCAYRLHQAIKIGQSQREIASARSFSQDNTGTDALWLLDEASQIASNGYLFDAFIEENKALAVEQLACKPLACIKFLNNKDAEFFSKLEGAQKAVFHLPLTFLRAQVFGLQQARLTEDLRQTKGQNIEQLTTLSDFAGFEKWYANLFLQIDKLDQSRLAIRYILFQYQHPNALACLIEQLDVEQKTELQSLVDETSTLALAENLAESLADVASEQIKQLRKAFAAVNRAGFKTLPEEKDIDLYVQGDEYLAILSRLLHKYIEQVSQEFQIKGGIVKSEVSDCLIFSRLFKSLYCNKGVQA